jgi:hypothetical protein
LLILKNIPLVFIVMQNRKTGKWFVLSIMHEIDRGRGCTNADIISDPSRGGYQILASRGQFISSIRASLCGED